MNAPISLAHLLAASYEADRHRDERLRAHRRALREAQAARRVEHPSARARLGIAIRTVVRRDHSLTRYPCRLPDGRMGRVAVVLEDGEWTLVCRVP